MKGVATAVLTRLAADPRGCVTVAEMLFDGYVEGGVDKRLHNALDVLERRGLVVKTKRGCYRLTESGRAWVEAGRAVAPGQGAHAVRQARGLPAAAWRWLRLRRKGSVAEMLSTLAEAGQSAAERQLRRYLKALAAAGYVQAMRRGGAVRYLLVRDSGRLAPVYRRASGCVYDPNTGESWPVEAA